MILVDASVFREGKHAEMLDRLILLDMVVLMKLY